MIKSSHSHGRIIGSPVCETGISRIFESLFCFNDKPTKLAFYSSVIKVSTEVWLFRTTASNPMTTIPNSLLGLSKFISFPLILFSLKLSAIPFQRLPRLLLTIILVFGSWQVTFSWNHIDKLLSPSLSQARGKPFRFSSRYPSHPPLLPRKYTSISISIYLNKSIAVSGAHYLVISLLLCLPKNDSANRLLVQSLYPTQWSHFFSSHLFLVEEGDEGASFYFWAKRFISPFNKHNEMTTVEYLTKK